jgi:hypothetical protein
MVRLEARKKASASETASHLATSDMQYGQNFYSESPVSRQQETDRAGMIRCSNYSMQNLSQKPHFLFEIKYAHDKSATPKTSKNNQQQKRPSWKAPSKSERGGCPAIS